MTTEDDFQRVLDANPEDWQTRLVFADWLEERGDARAEGYRALGALRRVPDLRNDGRFGWTHASDLFWHLDHRIRTKNASCVPSSWWDAIYSHTEGSSRNTRHEAEDAAALAFAQLDRVWLVWLVA